MTDQKRRAAEIIERLKKEYADAHIALNFSNPFELLVATILSAQCTDERVNLVTGVIFRKYRTVRDYAEVETAELADDLKSINFFNNKTKSIRGAAQKIIDDFGGEVPQTMDELLTLSGVARKTANVVLGNAFGIRSGIVVDTHVARVSQRLVLTENSAPEKIEKDLCALVPPNDWVQFPHCMIAHGRKICQARKPKCRECVLENLCPSSLLKRDARAE